MSFIAGIALGILLTTGAALIFSADVNILDEGDTND
jgi:hypothetical protein